MPTENLRIEPDKAKAEVDAGKAIILDVVAPDAWKNMKRQVAGAIRIEPEEFGFRYKELPLDKHIIAYCTWDEEHTSAGVARDLRKAGYQAFALKGGFAAWEEAGYPTQPKKGATAKVK